MNESQLKAMNNFTNKVENKIGAIIWTIEPFLSTKPNEQRIWLRAEGLRTDKILALSVVVSPKGGIKIYTTWGINLS
jgi:hypothetical protein